MATIKNRAAAITVIRIWSDARAKFSPLSRTIVRGRNIAMIRSLKTRMLMLQFVSLFWSQPCSLRILAMMLEEQIYVERPRIHVASGPHPCKIPTSRNPGGNLSRKSTRPSGKLDLGNYWVVLAVYSRSRVNRSISKPILVPMCKKSVLKFKDSPTPVPKAKPTSR